MSPAKNSKRKGWTPPAGMRLRKGQALILDEIWKTDKEGQPRQKLVAEFPTGYGKTLAICLAYMALRDAGKANRLLIVVPTAEQLSSYAETIHEDFAKLGTKIQCAIATEACSLKYHRDGIAEVYVSTIQAIASQQKRDNGGVLLELLSGKHAGRQYRWMAAYDELHHYSEGNSWGQALQALDAIEPCPFVYRLGLSATPDRKDGHDTVLGKPDISVGLLDAVGEDAIRRTTVHKDNYFVDVSIGGGDPMRTSLIELANLAGEGEDDGGLLSGKIPKLEISRELRYYDKYLSSFLKAALDCHADKDEEHPGQHRMIVFAASCGHAGSTAKIINELHYSGEKIADWVGTGPNGRSPQKNKEIIADFKAGKIQVLCQYAVAGEGFDCRQASTAVFLNLLSYSNLLVQMMGRVLRRNYAAVPFSHDGPADDFADIFVPPDHPAIKYFCELEGVLNQGKPPKPRGGEGDTPIYPIPDFFLLGSEFKDSEFYYPLGGGEKVSEARATAIFRREVPGADGLTDEQVRIHLDQYFGRAPVAESLQEKASQARERTTKAVAKLAGNVLRLRAKQDGSESVRKDMIRDLIKAIHVFYKRHFEPTPQTEMTFDQLVNKYNWVQSVNDGIKETKEVPQWLMI